MTAADEFFVEWHALGAEGAVLGVVGREVAAHQAEDGPVAVELHGRAAPEAADADHLAAELLHQIDQQVQRRPGGHQIFDQEDFGARAHQALELYGQRDAALAARQPLRAVDDGGSRRVGARHAMGQDQRRRPRREHHVDRPLGEVLGDHRAEPFGERGLRGHQRLLDVLGRVLAGGQEDVVVRVIGARPLEDLEVDLLPDLVLDGGGIFPGGGHPGPPVTHYRTRRRAARALLGAC